jgi:hypothetical protein
MRLLEISVIVIAAGAAVAPASADPESGDLAFEMRAALEAHARLPAGMPELPDEGTPRRDAPGRTRPGTAREQGLAAADVARQRATEHAGGQAASLALEMLGRDVREGPAAAASAVAGVAEAEAAVGLAAGAAARGIRPPMPLWEPEEPIPAPAPETPAPGAP